MIKPRNSSPEGMGRADYGLAKKSRPSGTMSAIEETRHMMNDFSEKLKGMGEEEVLSGLKWFIEEREEIRKKKEAGEPRPWTQDEVLDKTKFTNIFRQDDRVSRFIFSRIGKRVEGPNLVYNLLMARLLNRVDVLDKVLPTSPREDLSFLLEGDAILMNSKAYQISPQMIRLDNYKTNRETIVYYPKKVYERVYWAITSTTDIKEAVEKGNKAFGGHIPFTMLQVVLDYHYLTGHYDDNSEIPVGQGAKAIVEKLGGLETLSKKLGMKKYDVEHAACEYRKYLSRQGKKLGSYSYKPNSMGIEE